MHPDAVMDSLRTRFTRRIVRCDDEGFVAGSTQMLENPDHRVADTIDLREEGLGDDRNAHNTRVAVPAVDKVAYGHTSCEICCSGRF